MHVKRMRVAIAMSASFVSLALVGHSQGAAFKPIIVAGTAAPGGGGATFSTSAAPAIDHAGNVASLGYIGPSTANDKGLWAGQPGDLTKVARIGEQVPGLIAGVNYLDLFNANVNNNGNLIFRAAATGAGVTTGNDGLVMLRSTSTVSVLAREGDQAPGAPAGILYGNLNDTSNQSSAYQPAHGNNGALAYIAPLAGAGVTVDVNDRAIWMGTSAANMTMLGRRGDSAPGADTAVFQNFARPVVNGNGMLATLGTLSGGGVTTSNDRGIWTSTGAALTKFVRAGEIAPGTGGASYDDFFVPGINDAGNIGFATILQGSGVTTANDRALYIGNSPASLTLLAREGDALPDAGPGITLQQINLPTLSGSNTIAFPGSLTGTGVTNANNTALWTANATDGLRTIAREGDAAPGTGPGVTLGSLQGPAVDMNIHGQAAFVVSLIGATTETDSALYFYDPTDGLTLLAREGQTVEFSPGVTRTISDMFFLLGTQNAGGQDGEYMSLNDAGEVAVFSLNGDSFVVAVPEPGSIAMLAIGALGLLARRRRARA
ncbi:MAG: PEP-CTERM sorting domain-containing protein [Planctomycetota bacterium]|nr:PEP-CTERM sorting domain-containing protein [Planctomycetota bacterium]